MSKKNLLVITALLLISLVMAACGAAAPAPALVEEAPAAEAPAAEEPAAEPSGETTMLELFHDKPTWADNSDNETNFIIEQSPNGTDSWAAAGQVSANATAFTHKDIGCDAVVYYRVKAINGGLASGYSNVANITHDANVPVTVKQYGHEVLTNITVTQK